MKKEKNKVNENKKQTFVNKQNVNKECKSQNRNANKNKQME